MFSKLFKALVIAPVEDVVDVLTDPLGEDINSSKSPPIARILVPGLSTVESLIEDD